MDSIPNYSNLNKNLRFKREKNYRKIKLLFQTFRLETGKLQPVTRNDTDGWFVNSPLGAVEPKYN